MPLSAVARDLPTYAPKGKLSAELVRTAYGVPHITARNLESLGFGYGFAFAEDNICVLADQIVKVTGERARWFGADRSPGDGANIISDVGYKALRLVELAENGFPTLSEPVRALMSGYAAGFNAHLAEVGPTGLPPECRDAPWVRPITAQDLLSYHLDIAVLSGAGIFLEAIANAAPPGDQPASERFGIPLSRPTFDKPGTASNAWALGAEKTANGRGAIFATPHLPNSGHLKLYEAHLTIPGILDVAGVSLYGIPLINIGFNRGVAWTHTTAEESEKFTLHRLKLLPADPTSYQFDGKTLQLESYPVTVDVKQPDGSLETVHQVIYRSRFGPMIEFSGPLDWTRGSAFSLRDPNLGNLEQAEHILSLNLATRLDTFRDTFRTLSGIAWNNTLAADWRGNAFYIDSSGVPDMTNEALERIIEDPEIAAAREAFGITILPGDTSLFDPPPGSSGVVPFDQRPQLLRRDFVANSNNSHWLAQPDQRLEGFSPLFRGERAPLSLRARLGLRMIAEDAGEDGRFDDKEIAASFFGNRLLLAELILPEVVDLCKARGDQPVELDGRQVVLTEACVVLAAWSGRANLDDRGMHIFREFAEHLPMAALGNEPFDADRPVETPAGLVRTDAVADAVIQALGRAVATLEDSGISPDARVAELQFFEKVGPDSQPLDPRVPLHGANHEIGAFNVQQALRGDDGTLLPQPSPDVSNDASDLGPDGYRIGFGASWVSVVAFNVRGPYAKGVLVYSQSSNSESPHFNDQASLFVENQLKAIPFRRDEIKAATISKRDLSGISRKDFD